MRTYPRHVLYFSRKFYLRQFDLFPKNRNLDPSCFDPIQKFGMSTRELTLIFDPVPSTYFRPPLYIIAALKNFYRSTAIVAGMSSLLVVILLLVYWDSG